MARKSRYTRMIASRLSTELNQSEVEIRHLTEHIKILEDQLDNYAIYLGAIRRLAASQTVQEARKTELSEKYQNHYDDTYRKVLDLVETAELWRSEAQRLRSVLLNVLGVDLDLFQDHEYEETDFN